MRRLRILVVAMAGWALCVQPAAAHIQVRPTVSAPGDPVLFQLVVPGERDDARTVEVALQMPKGVLPFSWEDTPGWRRKIEKASDGSVDVVRWRGRLDKDGFARFAFLASTPEQEGEIQWKAIQTYDDGKKSSWIGSPNSENPAAVTRVSRSAPRENAGGEGQDGGGGAEPEATPTATAAAATTDDDGEDDDGGGGSTAALIVGGLGLVLGASALALTLQSRRRPT